MPVRTGQRVDGMQDGSAHVGGQRQFRLTVIRHGETVANREKILQGQMDYELSDVGRGQARQLGGKLRGSDVAAAFTSDLCRASETADLILEQMLSPLKAVRRVELKERSFGQLEGQPTAELHKAAKEAEQSIVDFTPPGGETLPCVQRRANAFCDYLCQMIGRNEIHSPKSESVVSFNHFPVSCCNEVPASVNGMVQPPAQYDCREEVEGRVVPGDEVRLQALDDQPHVMVVSHGGFMRCLFKHFYDKHKCKNLSPQGFKSTPPNTSLNTFVFTIKWVPSCRAVAQAEGMVDGEWKVTALECTALHDNSGQLR